MPFLLASLVRRMSFALALLLVLGACSSDPFPAATPANVKTEAAKDPVTATLMEEPGARFFALCYSSQINEPADVRAAAQELCPYQGRLAVVSQDAFWNACALIQPSRVTYICVPGEPPPAEN